MCQMHYTCENYSIKKIKLAHYGQFLKVGKSPLQARFQQVRWCVYLGRVIIWVSSPP